MFHTSELLTVDVQVAVVLETAQELPNGELVAAEDMQMHTVPDGTAAVQEVPDAMVQVVHKSSNTHRVPLHVTWALFVES